MHAQAQHQAAVTFKPYTEKSNARRALLRYPNVGTVQVADTLLREIDGKWGFLLADGMPYVEPKADEPVTVQAATPTRDYSINAPAMTTADAPRYPDEDDGDDGTPTTSGAFAAMVNPVAAPKAAAGLVVRDGKKVDPNAPAPSTSDKAVNPVDACPLCGGVHTEQRPANEGVSASCGVCKQTYSIKTGRVIAHAGHTREGVNKGYTIEKNRTTQNGKTMRSPGTICGNIWLAFDTFAAANGGVVIAGDLDAIATAGGWNRNNVSCEFYAWRKFHGIKGRQTRPAVEAVTK